MTTPTTIKQWSLLSALSGYQIMLNVRQPTIELRFKSYDEFKYFEELLSKDQIGKRS